MAYRGLCECKCKWPRTERYWGSRLINNNGSWFIDSVENTNINLTKNEDSGNDFEAEVDSVEVSDYKTSTNNFSCRS